MLKLKTILQYKYTTFLIMLLTITISFIGNSITKYPSVPNKNRFIGIVTEIKIDGDKLSLVLKDKQKYKVTYYLKDKSELKKYNNILGFKVSIEGEVQIPNNNTIPNTFNYKKYLNNNSIYYVINAKKIDIISPNKNLVLFIKNKINNYLNNFKSKKYLKMFILGDKSALDEDVYNNFQASGVVHIFAISGMHISMISGIILFLLKKLKKRYLITIGILIFYSMLIPFPSVYRSVIFFILYYLNTEYELNLDSKKILYLTISIMLIFNSKYLYNISFLYSVIISYSLLLITKVSKNYLINIFKISLVAFLFSLPITVSINYNVNILSVFNNLIIVPLISFIVYPLSLLTLIFPFLDSVLLFITSVLEFVTEYLLVFNISIPKMGIIVSCIYYLIVWLLLNTYDFKYLLVFILFIIILKYKSVLDNNLYISVLDVNQGDSILIKNKLNGILIDTGGKNGYEKELWRKKKEFYYSDNYIKYFKSMGITNIKYLIITHGDYDHMGESIRLIKNFKVENVIFNCNEFNDLEKKLIEELDNKKIKYFYCINTLNLNGIEFKFLNTREYNSENDNSSVLYLNIGDFKFLFMGDAGEAKEIDLLDKYNLRNIDFLKVGHHGSNTSSSNQFINNVNPKYSLISVGAHNRYGHPKDEVLETLKNSKIYRTDLDGSIEIKLNKNGYKIMTSPP